ncbi:MAG: energy transducer TonB [Bacteroidia bacterium]|nr:energy transducer TonB [Bacteroidia bacterium]
MAHRNYLGLGLVALLAGCGADGTGSDEATDTTRYERSVTITADRIDPATGKPIGEGEGKATVDRGPFDADTDGDGLFDDYLAEFEDEPLTEPDRTQATQDYNPPPDDSEFVKVDTDAEPLNLKAVHAAIVYPPDAKAAGKQGTVSLKVLIDADGWYGQHKVRSSPDKRLTAAVVEQVKKIRYRPAKLDGKPVKVWVNFEHTFRLEKP